MKQLQTLRKLQFPEMFGATNSGPKFVLKVNGRKIFLIKQQLTLKHQQWEVLPWELCSALRSWGEGRGKSWVEEGEGQQQQL